MSVTATHRPSTSDSQASSFASNEQESAYLKRTRAIQWARLALAAVILSASAALVGCEAHSRQIYDRTRSYEAWWLVLLPSNLDIRPTNAVLSCGTLILFSAVVYLLVAAFPTPHSQATRLNVLAGAVALSGFITALVGVIFAIHLPGARVPDGYAQNETLQSWTCKWAPINRMVDEDGNPLVAPAGFAQACRESRAGFALLCTLLGLEVLMGVGALAGWWVEKDVRQARKQAGDVELAKQRAEFKQEH